MFSIFTDVMSRVTHSDPGLPMVICTKICLLCDTHVIASALGQLWINFTCIFKVFQIALVASRLRQFFENFENTRESNP